MPRIGNTPLIRINSLSDALGVEILVSLVQQHPYGDN
jgi:cysteine synthase